MANCHNLFEEFNSKIRLDDDKRVNLRAKRNTLRDKIKLGFAKIRSVTQLNEAFVSVKEEMEFQSQGSYVMDTIISPATAEDEYDLDDGVYFIGKLNKNQRPRPQTFHDFIVESIKQGKGDHEIDDIIDKETCVRVKFKGKNGDFNYHIDIPIYYATSVKEPELADTNVAKGWYVSNPVEFIVWFENLIQSGFKAEFILERKLYQNEYDKWLNDRRKADHQLRRIVRYLKSWSVNTPGDMPPGVVMTILAGVNSNFVPDNRDDVSLRATLVNIQKWLIGNGFKCPRPTTPKGDDLFAGYSVDRKANFRKALESFVASANQALESANPKEACQKWQKHLGPKFPCHMAKDEIENSNVYAAPTAIRSSNPRSA